MDSAQVPEGRSDEGLSTCFTLHIAFKLYVDEI